MVDDGSCCVMVLLRLSTLCFCTLRLVRSTEQVLWPNGHLWAEKPLLRPHCKDGGSPSHLSGLYWAPLFPSTRTTVLYCGSDGYWARVDWTFRAHQCPRHLESQIILCGGIRLLFLVLVSLGFIPRCACENLALSVKPEQLDSWLWHSFLYQQGRKANSLEILI